MLDEIFSPLWSTDWGRRCSLVLLIVVFLVLVIVLIQAPLSWYADAHLVKTSPSSKISIASQKQDSLSLPSIASAHLFGQAPPSDLSMAITSQDLRLLGIMRAVPARFSSALISVQGAPAKSYEVGDHLPGGLVLAKITTNDVILNNAGEFEKLPLIRQLPQWKKAPGESL